jgi:non-ribosomal peptide synthetase component E (peptide arylation enzyme)
MDYQLHSSIPISRSGRLTMKPSRYSGRDIADYFASGLWRKETISEVWDQNALANPDRIAIEDTSTAFTWKEALDWIDRVSVGLVGLGIFKDQVLVIQLPNCVELHLLRVACEKVGVISVPVVTTMREHEMEYILKYTSAPAVVIPSVFRNTDYVATMRKIKAQVPSLEHVIVMGEAPSDLGITLGDLVSRSNIEGHSGIQMEGRRSQAEEISSICLTSGTTGFPKFVEYPAAACVADGRDLADLLHITPEDIVAAVAPAARGPNVTIYYGAAQVSAKIVMLPWQGPDEMLRLIEEKRVTVAGVVPAQLAMMLERNRTLGHDLSSVRTWVSAGSVLPPALAKAVEEEIGGIVLSQYGAVDFGRMAIPRPEDDLAIRMSTVGKPGRGTFVKIVDDDGSEVPQGTVGAILAKGPYCSSGYFRDPDATNEVWNSEGWYSTGDLGRLDEHSNLIIAGRKKDMIIRGGQNIIPAEIEGLLITHPAIQNVAIVSMPDIIMGEKACAYVILKAGKELALSDIVSFLKQKDIASFKLPERLEIVDSFPMVADGQKIDKKTLAQDIAEKLARKG